MCGSNLLKPDDLCRVNTDAALSTKIEACDISAIIQTVCYCGNRATANVGDYCDIETGVVTHKCENNAVVE